MANAQDDDMYLFQGGMDQTPAGFAGQDFDSFLTSGPSEADEETPSAGFLNPNDLSIKRERDGRSPQLEGRFARSTSSSDTSSSSASSRKRHNRHISAASTASAATRTGMPGSWGSGINGLSMPSHENFFDDTSMTGLYEDDEASNQQMASDFDFETAASTPSGFDSAAMPTMKAIPGPQPFRTNANLVSFSQTKNSPRLPAAQAQFFLGGSREASPLHAMLPTAPTQSPWSKHSPSSGLEETFNHITMNGDSPGNATFSPNLHFAPSGFSFEPDSSATPSTYNKDLSSPPSTIHSADGAPQLTVYPTSLKSRVETQIPIKMTLSPLPPNVKKLRLPTYTVSKPKFLAKPEIDRSPEIFELYTSLVCSSAMQDPVRLDRALARARGEELGPFTRPSPASSNGSQSSKDDDEKPLNGGEVRICLGCIQRERKRASRKKQKKPEEEEMFQKDEERRVVVFNTSEVKDWVEVTNDPQPGAPIIPDGQGPTPGPGAMQVELPMRIACYCRHQNEKMGFQVIFTIKDYRDKVVAQAMTNSIMITDDHKTHNAPPPASNGNTPLPTAPQLPGAGVFSTSGMDMPPGLSGNAKLFKQSFSTTDLHGLQHNFNPNFPMAPSSNPFAIPAAASVKTSATLTPRNLSRPASPSGPSGPTTKRRKQSGSGKLPSGLMMTRLDGPHISGGASTMPNSAASSPFAPSMNSFMGPADRQFAVAPPRSQTFGTSPPTPSGNESGFGNGIGRSFSLENLPRHALMSAPNSRQPSRPGSPGSGRNSFGAAEPGFGQAVSNQLMGHPSRRPPPLIHKLVPAEGSVTGGTEVTLLGNGFYQGLEVMFGDTEATTTTFWGEKCLNCIAPPAIQPGVVAVVFKHEHPQYSSMPQQSQSRPSVFTYIDDREIEMFRLALRTLGKQMQHPTDDPYSAAQQLLQGQSQSSIWSSHGNYGMNGGHQRHAPGPYSSQTDPLELETSMLLMLAYLDELNPAMSMQLDARRPNGMTLLHLASSLGLPRFVAQLLARGANPNMLDNNGNSPMHHAALNGHTHIIHRLRLGGGNHRSRSLRNYTPSDLATSLLTYQATTRPDTHYRSRSADGTPMRLHSRNTSSTSLKAFWENASTNHEDSESDSFVEDDSDISSVTESFVPVGRAVPFQTLPGLHSSASCVPSRRGSSQPAPTRTTTTVQHMSDDAKVFDPPVASLVAWRDSLAAQIAHFQEIAQWPMPSLPTLPTLPALPDYQTNPMVRRVSSLFPHRPASRDQGHGGGQREGWWEAFTGSSPSPNPAPPAYDELFPDKQAASDDFEMKKTSAVAAAADAAADLHFELQSEPLRASSHKSDADVPAVDAVSHKRPQIRRVELMRDRKLFLFWIPLLALVLGLMMKNSAIWQIVPMMYNQPQQDSAGARIEQLG